MRAVGLVMLSSLGEQLLISTYKESETKLNNTVRTITWNKKFLQVTQSYKNLQLLKLSDDYDLELAKFMRQIYNNKIPFSFQDKLTKLEKIHSHKIRKPSSSNIFFPRVLKNAGQKKLKFKCEIVWMKTKNQKISFDSKKIIKKHPSRLH